MEPACSLDSGHRDKGKPTNQPGRSLNGYSSFTDVELVYNAEFGLLREKDLTFKLWMLRILRSLAILSYFQELIEQLSSGKYERYSFWAAKIV